MAVIKRTDAPVAAAPAEKKEETYLVELAGMDRLVLRGALHEKGKPYTVSRDQLLDLLDVEVEGKRVFRRYTPPTKVMVETTPDVPASPLPTSEKRVVEPVITTAPDEKPKKLEITSPEEEAEIEARLKAAETGTIEV